MQAVVGIEQMKTVDSALGGSYLGTAAWYEKEAEGIDFPFPKLFGRLGDEYGRQVRPPGRTLGRDQQAQLRQRQAESERANAHLVHEPRDHALSRGDDNAQVGGRIRLADCSQVTDGAVCVFLASRRYAQEYAAKRGISINDIPRIKGWGHNTARLRFEDKVAESKDAEYVLPHVRSTVTSAMERAGMSGVEDIDGIETHDCFTTSEYMAIDHFGITAPGESWKAVEEGWLEIDGKTPINPSGGLIGAGHPVGATGVRQLLDATKQVTGQAGDYQVAGAKNFQTLNIGGSGTTSCSFIVGV